MYYIEKGLGKGYRWLALLFAVSGAFACLGMGAMNQSNAIAQVFLEEVAVPEWISGVMLSIIAFIAISGGVLRISRLTEKLVPFMAGIYMLAGGAAVLIAPTEICNALKEIVMSALAPKAIYGGMGGEMMKRAMRFGISRGVFSNEAGLGSAPLVHAAADAESPTAQGLWGIFEVFVDTILVCTITAVIIIGSGYHLTDASGTAMVTLAFSKYFGWFGNVIVSVTTILFALSTILGWSYYGERCILYLANDRTGARGAYRVVFAFSVLLGALLNIESVWEIADMFNGIMMIPNLIAILLLSDIVIRETKTTFSDGNV